MEGIGVLWQAFSEVATLLNAKLIELSEIVGVAVGQIVDILAK